MARAVECPDCGEDVPPNGTKVVDCPSCGETVTFPFAVHGPGGSPPDRGSSGSTGRSAAQASASKQGMRAEEAAVKFYRRVGCQVYEIRPLARMKGISKGIPDLTVFAGEFGGAPAPMWYHEVKAGDSRQSPEQQEFQERCEEAGIPYVLGDARAAARFLGFDV